MRVTLNRLACADKIPNTTKYMTFGWPDSLIRHINTNPPLEPPYRPQEGLEGWGIPLMEPW